MSKSNNAKQKILDELNLRLDKLNRHYNDKKETDGNPKSEMLVAEGKLLNAAIATELRSLSEFVEANITD